MNLGKHLLCTLILVSVGSAWSGTIAAGGTAFAQAPAVHEGNKLYREGKYEEAVKVYGKAMETSPENVTVLYNRSNALARKGDAAAALEGYETIIEKNRDKKITQQSWYNKGVMHQQQKELDKSIEAWKSALMLDPEDQQARENLQKALREKKEQQKKEQEQKQEQPQQQKKQEQQQPRQQQSRLTQKQVEQLLKALEQKEKEVQKKLQKSSGSSQPEKDW